VIQGRDLDQVRPFVARAHEIPQFTLSDLRRHLRAQLFSDLIKRWQGAADPSDNQLACEERDIAMMRKIAAACLLVLLVAPLRGRTDDDFSCV
jgi:hypothetical protein